MTGSMVERIAERFWSKVTAGGPNECWNWNGAKQDRGYGAFWMNGRMVRATRASLALAGKQVPENSDVCHSCDNPSCVNPRHLWVGTRSENMKDAVRKGRAVTPTCSGLPGWQADKTHCPKGHPFDSENTIRVKRNSRRCRQCSAEYYREYRRRKSAALKEGQA